MPQSTELHYNHETASKMVAYDIARFHSPTETSKQTKQNAIWALENSEKLTAIKQMFHQEKDIFKMVQGFMRWHQQDDGLEGLQPVFPLSNKNSVWLHWQTCFWESCESLMASRTREGHFWKVSPRRGHWLTDWGPRYRPENRCRTSIWHLLMIKNSQQNRRWRNLPQPNEGHVWQAHS